jgi:CHAT domain-containing protein/ribosomal protein S7
MSLTIAVAFGVLLRSLAGVLGAAFFVVIAMSPAVAQQVGDLKATLKRFEELYNARNYPAALVEAQKIEAGVKARLGVNNAAYGEALYNLGLVHFHQRNYRDAEALYKRALAIDQQAPGQNDRTVAVILHALGNVSTEQGKYAEAEPFLQRALAIQEHVRGQNHGELVQDLASTLNDLASVNEKQGKYAAAERIVQRSLLLSEQKFGQNHPEVAIRLYNLAAIDSRQGKYAEADRLYRRALAIYQQAHNPRVANVLWGLASLDREQGKHAEADELYRRVLVMKEQALGPNHPDVGNVLMALASNLTDQALASNLTDQGKYAEAEEICRRALVIQEQSLGQNHPEVADTLSTLAIVYRIQERYAEAEALHRRALAIREQALGPNHRDVADSLHSLAVMNGIQGKYAEAEGLYRRALAIYEQALGENHPDIAHIFDNLWKMSVNAGNAENALAYARRATAAVISHAATEAPSTRNSDAAGLLALRTSYFLHHLASLDDGVRDGREARAAGTQEAFEIAQWANHSSAAGAVQQMGLRFASGSAALAALVRERQDLSAMSRNREGAMIAALSRPAAQQDAAQIAALRKQLAEIENRLTAIEARLEKQFPDYAALASPKPINAQELQRLLGKDEALVFVLSAEGHWETYLFVVTQEGFEWRTIPLKGEALAQKVAAFRRGLDVDALHRGLARLECTQAEADKRGLSRIECGQELAKECEEAEKRGLARPDCATAKGRRELFDLGLAHELYGTLLGPVEPLIKDKRNLIVVPSGALTALPFHLLVTEQPVEVNTPRDLAAYRDAAWLLKRHAVSVLPSVASLKALRAFAHKDVAGKPLVGFGDPVFNAEEEGRSGAEHQRTVVATRSYTEFWKGVEIDRSTLSKALPRLPETAAELRAVAKNLGAPESGLHLRQDASETTVKRSPLSDYRVVYFATHGLVAGEIKGLAEPSLALTLPKQPSETDDGLLTASEVAQLKLNADWVVLSACNTIAGDKPGAEALSGLARAFFYAGAHALLVSHWAVESNAAMRLTTSTFDIMKSDPTLGRAEALRRAMLAYMNDATNPLNAYPALWAPFVVVGEGAGQFVAATR